MKNFSDVHKVHLNHKILHEQKKILNKNINNLMNLKIQTMLKIKSMKFE
jgi:hypothetical protein